MDKFLKDLDNQQYTNITIIFIDKNENKLEKRFHKSVLGLHSKMFHSMFNFDKEKNIFTFDQLESANIAYQSVLTLYGVSPTKKTPRGALRLVKCCDFFQIPFNSDWIINLLKLKKLTKKNVERIAEICYYLQDKNYLHIDAIQTNQFVLELRYINNIDIDDFFYTFTKKGVLINHKNNYCNNHINFEKGYVSDYYIFNEKYIVFRHTNEIHKIDLFAKKNNKLYKLKFQNVIFHENKIYCNNGDWNKKITDGDKLYVYNINGLEKTINIDFIDKNYDFKNIDHIYPLAITNGNKKDPLKDYNSNIIYVCNESGYWGKKYIMYYNINKNKITHYFSLYQINEKYRGPLFYNNHQKCFVYFKDANTNKLSILTKNKNELIIKKTIILEKNFSKNWDEYTMSETSHYFAFTNEGKTNRNLFLLDLITFEYKEIMINVKINSIFFFHNYEYFLINHDSSISLYCMEHNKFILNDHKQKDVDYNNYVCGIYFPNIKNICN